MAKKTRKADAQAQSENLDEACADALARACKALKSGQDCLNKRSGWQHTRSTGRRRAVR
jgi:hypothetical protein